MNKLLKYCLLFIVIFFVAFFITYVCGTAFCDEIWSYGFSYNISSGMVIYRDFNVLQTPLYFFVASIFIRVFGSYLISMHIFDSILISFMGLMLYRIIKWKFILVLPCIMVFMPSGYNLLSLFWVVVIIFLINTKKDCDLLIAFVVGLLFITKQNLGVMLFLPCFYYSKKKVKSIFVFFIPFLFLCIYLLYNQAFYQFIDYCFLGLFDFNGKNKYFVLFFVVCEVLVLLYLLFKLFKNHFRNMEVFYILCFQFMVYPILEARHFSIAFFPVMYLIVKDIYNKYILSLFFVAFYLCNLILFSWFSINIHFDKDLFYLRNSGNLSQLADYFNEYVDDLNYLYSPDVHSYFIKLYHHVPIGQYDLMISGNMGYHGFEKKSKELSNICLKHRCFFMIFAEDYEFNQFIEFRNYIVSNYDKIDKVYGFYIYSS